jgi:hypothetical protein
MRQVIDSFSAGVKETILPNACTIRHISVQLSLDVVQRQTSLRWMALALRCGRSKHAGKDDSVVTDPGGQ